MESLIYWQDSLTGIVYIELLLFVDLQYLSLDLLHHYIRELEAETGRVSEELITCLAEREELRLYREALDDFIVLHNALQLRRRKAAEAVLSKATQSTMIHLKHHQVRPPPQKSPKLELIRAKHHRLYLQKFQIVHFYKNLKRLKCLSFEINPPPSQLPFSAETRLSFEPLQDNFSARCWVKVNSFQPHCRFIANCLPICIIGPWNRKPFCVEVKSFIL